MLKPSITFVICRRGQVLRRVTVQRGVIRIGRHRSNHLQLEDEAVSKRHAVIELSPERISLIDLAEHAALRVNGQVVDEATLAVGDRIAIGSTEILIEEVVMQEALLAPPSSERELAADSTPLPAPLPGRTQPFAASAPNAPAFTYALLRSGPAVRAEEVELTHVLAAEVSISWGENVLHVAHLAAGQTFYVGDEQGPNQPCDFLIPREKLGMARMPLVLPHGAGFGLVIAAHALGHVLGPDGVLHGMDAVRAAAPECEALPGARILPLALGTRAELRFGDIVFKVGAVRAGKPVGHGLAAGLDTGALPYFALSALSFGGLLSSMAFLVPPLALLSDEESDDDRLYLLQQYLAAAAEREQQPQSGAQSEPGAKSSDSGAAAAGEAGAMGGREAPKKPGHYTIQGDAAREDRQLSRHEVIESIPDFGMIGLLNSAAGDPNTPVVPWGADHAIGGDAESLLGNLWSDDPGAALGNGLTFAGTGESGGGKYKGIGVGDKGTLGHLGDQEGKALSRGHIPGGHRTQGPQIRPAGDLTLSGRLPPDTIRRVVRQNHPRFRNCYEKGLMTNPSLTGRVGVRFVIGRAGRVTHAADGGSDLPDAGVVNCVTRAFYDIGFPKPEGGVVTVQYPILFQPE
jgi:pSer/pThr/pTyr-binding forkhead associated (FHA) protein